MCAFKEDKNICIILSKYSVKNECRNHDLCPGHYQLPPEYIGAKVTIPYHLNTLNYSMAYPAPTLPISFVHIRPIVFVFIKTGST